MFRRWVVAHVKRGANSAAHGLAKLAVQEQMIKYGWRRFLVAFMIL